MNHHDATPAESGPELTVAVASDTAAVRAVAGLFEAYRASLDVDLCFQGFDAELAGLPGAYGESGGGLWLARLGERPVGCCAVRPAPAGGSGRLAELKRLYVTPEARGHGVGRRLLTAALTAARAYGYEAIVLDTLPGMRAARALYADLGFERMRPYYDTPIRGTEFMRLDL
jgi:ribosomal protein S18 acetylase RimI-like enzyme